MISTYTAKYAKSETHDDISHIILLDLGCQVDVDFDSVLRVLLFDSV